MKSYKEIVEGKKDYVIYHKQYSAAATEIEKFVVKNGYTLDDESHPDNKGTQMFDEIGAGPVKPKDGKTNKFHFKLYKNNELVKRKMLHAQIYGDENKFELNMYIS